MRSGMESDAFRACAVEGCPGWSGGGGGSLARSSGGQERYIRNGLCDYFVTLVLKAAARRPMTGTCASSPRSRQPLVLALPSAASAAPYTAPGGKVLWGGQGGYKPGNISDFARRSGRAPAVYNYFIAWKGTDPAMHWLSFRLGDARAHGSRPMLSIGTEGSALSPGSIAAVRATPSSCG